MVIFHCYVSSPDGISPYFGITWVNLWINALWMRILKAIWLSLRISFFWWGKMMCRSIIRRGNLRSTRNISVDSCWLEPKWHPEAWVMLSLDRRLCQWETPVKCLQMVVEAMASCRFSIDLLWLLHCTSRIAYGILIYILQSNQFDTKGLAAGMIWQGNPDNKQHFSGFLYQTDPFGVLKTIPYSQKGSTTGLQRYRKPRWYFLPTWLTVSTPCWRERGSAILCSLWYRK